MNGITEGGGSPSFASRYKHIQSADATERTRISFSVKHSRGAAFYAGLGGSAGTAVDNIFYIYPNGTVNFFGSDILSKTINDKKFCNVDIILDRPNGTAKLYIDGDMAKSVKTTDYPTSIDGMLFEKLAYYDVCIDDIEIKNDSFEPKIQIISNSPYYAQTFDRDNGVIYAYGQKTDRFLQKLYVDGMTDAQFVDEHGASVNDKTITAGRYLRFKDELGRCLYFNIETGTKSALLAIDDINKTSDANPDTENYYIYEQPDASKLKGSALDMSAVVLDGPAGKYGFVRTKDDGFVCVDDSGAETSIQFWGTNIGGAGAFPSTHDEAKKIADSVAAAGFNLVRFHNIDWAYLPNVFGAERVTSGKKLDDVQMDKLCYLMYELKQRGIYFFVDQTVSRPIFADDGAPEGVTGTKGVAYFSEPVIAALEGYSELLLNYTNPYTKLALKDDPAMALIDLNNENSLEYFDIRSLIGTEYYADYKKQYNEWLVEKYGTRDALAQAWKVDPRCTYFANGLGDNEDPINGTVEVSTTYTGSITDNGSKKMMTTGRILDEKRFIGYIYEKYFTRRINHLRNMGVKCAITGATSWGGLSTESWYPNYSSTDFVDTHGYWSHPSGGDNTLAGNGTRFDTNSGYRDASTGGKVSGVTSNLKADGLGLFGRLATGNTYGKPYTISEYKVCPGNRYLAEGPILASAYGRLQGWNPLDFIFSDSTDVNAQIQSGKKIPLKGTFQTFANPTLRAVFPATSVMFLRKDVSEATSGYYYNYSGAVTDKGSNTTEGSIYHVGPNSNYTTWPNNVTWPDGHSFENMGNYALVGKTGVSFNTDLTSVNSKEVKSAADAATNGDKVYTSLTNELTADLKNGIFKINTASSQALCGFIGGKNYSTDKLRVKISNEYAAVMLVSLDEEEITNSKRMLLTMAGNSVNNGQLLSEDGTTIEIAGKYPIMVEQITGEIEIAAKGSFDVYPLTSSGERKEKLNVTYTANGFKFTVGRNAEAMNFEIIKK